MIKIRTKGKYKDGRVKYVLYEMIEGKEVVHATIPRPEKLLEILRLHNSNGSSSSGEDESTNKPNEEFAHELLTEVSNGKENKTDFSDDTNEMLWEISK